MTTALERAIQLNQTTANDVAIVNTGAWYMGHGERADTAHLQEVQGFAALMSRKLPRMPRVIWRETYASHFDSTDGVFQSTALTRSGIRPTCTEWNGWEKPRVLQRVHRLLRASEGVELLPLWEATRDLAALHAQTDALHYNTGDAADCLHFCLFSGIEDAVMDAVAETLHAPKAV